MNLLQAIENRRTYYSIDNTKIVSEAAIAGLVKHSLKHAPSSFNSQSFRCVVLFDAEHETLWNITQDELKKIVPPENFKATEERLQLFRNGYGTILYFEDCAVVEGLQVKFPPYKEKFPVWAQQSNAMLQYVIWMRLEAEGLGVSLQHYNPLIDAAVKARWNLPDSWELIGQMPFGRPTGKPDDKEFPPVDEYVLIKK